MNDLVRPLPEFITPETQSYWEGLKNHRIMLPNCENCGAFFHPRILCPKCHSRNVSWIEASGLGKLFSFQIAYRSFNPSFKIEAPYILAMVQLEEGPRLMTNLINIEPDPRVVKCDMPVNAVFEKLNQDITLLLFEPKR